MKAGASMLVPCMILATVLACWTSPSVALGSGSPRATMDRELRSDESAVKKGVNPRIFGGTTISPTVNPWMVHIEFYFDYDNPQYCGGSYIGSASSTSHFFLTAANCIPTDRSSITKFFALFFFDDVDFYYSNDEDAFWLAVVNYTVGHDVLFNPHPAFSAMTSGSLENDIAIVEIQQYMDPADLPPPVSLADAGSSINDGTSVQVLGYGATNEDPDNDELRSVYLNAVDTDDCASTYELSSDLDQYLCAAAPGKGICDRDFGGPLFLTQGSEDIQLGIASFSDGCDRGGYPGVYTSVAAYKSWIDSVVGPGVVNYTSYTGSNGEDDTDGTSPSSATRRILGVSFVLSLAAGLFML
ncbi:Serine protease 56 [Hondaea fermentalgiana]|uniref:Serine protease 56 n=1 Tax=Hondaea fermentalgiana TaxID=2315210 RepID=A0A2R5GIA6_9STRA|nr:Serine protease 56 [Hondaea fermentalgiana]|eukprot:GBG30630.1 Serine protease 56 [Hondaea fermentalgiana]